MLDMAVYGTLMGALCLVAFVLVVYGFGGGNLGENCNREYSASCDVVFRARATVFALLTWTLLLFAWECKHFERSLFNLTPGQPEGIDSMMYNIYANRFLFWAIVVAFLSVFPVIYIPKLNVSVFKQSPISWEWVIVFSGLLFFLLGVESWKYMKRRLMKKGDNMGQFGRRIRAFVTDESRIRTEASSNSFATDLTLIDKPHLFGRSPV
jgi:P-type Na+/K+ transporter